MRDFDVAVIGAGAAGLAAAKELSQSGLRVVVLEARDRIGGRVHTSNHHLSVTVELGAELLHGGPKTNSLWSLAREVEQSPYRIASKGVVGLDGKCTSLESLAPADYAKRLLDVLSRYLGAGSTCSGSELLKVAGIETADHKLFWNLLTIDTDSMESLELISLLEHAAAKAARPDETFSADYRVPGGYSRLLERLADGLAVELNWVASRVVDAGDEVTVYDIRGKSVSCRHCVVAVPAGVLSSGAIKVSSPLTASRVSALSGGRYFPIVKILMEFDEPVLPEGWDEIADFTMDPPSYWNGSAGIPALAGQVVVGCATGDSARRLSSMTEHDRFSTMLASLKTILRRPELRYRAAVTHDWASDPFAFGGYGYWPGENAIYEPAGNIHWAGMIQSQVDLAYDSGVMAARRLLERLSTVSTVAP